MNILQGFFIFHLIVCLVLFVLRLVRILKCDYIHILIALLVPLWGVGMLFTKVFTEEKENRKRYKIELSKMETDAIRRSIEVEEGRQEVLPINEALLLNDTQYQRELMKDILYDMNASITIDNDDVVDMVVPLQEAMVMNDSATKRTLIMDVLYSNPSDYISQLTEAKKTDDTEVVHYAVTALVEMQKEFDVKFQELQKRREANPEDETAMKEYMRLQERYISCGLLEGDGLRTQQIKYRNMLLEAIDKGNRSWSLQCKLADVDLQLKDEKELIKDVQEMIERWPERESTYVYRMHLAVLQRDPKSIAAIIKEIEDRDVYVSAELRDMIQFWSKKE